MNNALSSLIGKQIEIFISSRQQIDTGILVDAGDDILVLYNRGRYYYIPVKHFHQLTVVPTESENANIVMDNPIDKIEEESISYRKTLLHARGVFVEMYITGRDSLFGYLSSIMNDYLVFYSTAFHTIYVPLEHVKAIVPYPANLKPYSMEQEQFSVKPSGMTLARTFAMQLKKLEGHMVSLDQGQSSNKVGCIKVVEGGTLTLIQAGGEEIIWNISHIKSAHLP